MRGAFFGIGRTTWMAAGMAFAVALPGGCGADDFAASEGVAGTAGAANGGGGKPIGVAGATAGGAGKSGTGATAKGGSGGATAEAGSGGAAGGLAACKVDADCGDRCTSPTVCSKDFTCVVVGMPPTKDDHNECTTDVCDPLTGAVSHSAVALSDNLPCTVDTCDPVKGVSHTLREDCEGCTVGADCNDDNPCTQDVCGGNKQCTNVPLPKGSVCAPATACFGAGTCDGAQACVPGAATDWSDGDACTVDSCKGNAIVHAAFAPKDDKCTETTCDPQTGKVIVRQTKEDGDKCTKDACDPATGVVSHSTIEELDDGKPCTTDTCDPINGKVSHDPVGGCTGCTDDEACDDRKPCTVDVCVTGQCKHSPAVPGSSCANPSMCDGQERCDDAGACLPGPAPSLDDGDPCTTDTCGATNGITHEKYLVDDGDPCTKDHCSESGAVHELDATCVACNDAGDCGTATDCRHATCVGGVCAFTATASGTPCGGGVGPQPGCLVGRCDGAGKCVPPSKQEICGGRCGTIKTGCGGLTVECPGCAKGTECVENKCGLP